jgi:hypothetical protein
LFKQSVEFLAREEHSLRLALEDDVQVLERDKDFADGLLGRLLSEGRGGKHQGKRQGEREA